jgi:two-component system phosphate regulon response regulator PhoB
MFQIVLEIEGYRAVVAHSASAAIQALENERPDLVILDVILRGTSGLDLCRYIRRDQSLADLPIVIVSVKGTPEDIQEGLAAGADAYLTKPVSQKELLTAVRQGLNPAS